MTASASLYSQTCYKKALKARLQEMKGRKSHLTLAKIAAQLPVQYTFLSKALGDSKAHLNEDHVFRMGQLLELLPEEIDYLLLLRSHATASGPSRREHLGKKLEKIRKEKVLSADHVEQNSARLSREMSHLLNPLCVLVQTALFIKDYEKNPRKLIPLLGTTEEKLREVLRVLELNDFVILGKDAFEIREVRSVFPHYGPDHPLMRLHQQILKTALIQKLNTISESDKESFFVTFTMDDATFLEVKKRFRSFLQDVQKLTFESKHKSVYQLSFDLMKWF